MTSTSNPIIGLVCRDGAIYLLTLFVNIAVNDWLLPHLPRFIPVTVVVAFVFATGVSALLNFLGMKFFIFKGSSL